MDSLVSILIPAYNAEAWIAETLRSALNQTWKHKEIIVVDDGSKDATFEVARTFEKDGVRVVRQENQGAAAARNHAFQLCKGEFIQWLDADDLLAPDKIACQMQEVAQGVAPQTLLSAGWAPFLYRPHSAKFVPTLLWCDLTPSEWLLRKLDNNLHMQPATWLVSRELTEAAGPWDTSMHVDDDGEYFCRVVLASDGIRFVPDAKVYYRQSGAGSLSYIGMSDRKAAAQWKSMRLHVSYMMSLDEGPRAKAACVQYLQNWLGSFYPDRPDLIAQAESLARELGGTLRPPSLSWKYAWIEPLFGNRMAKKIGLAAPRMRWAAARVWDRLMFQVESRLLPE